MIDYVIAAPHLGTAGYRNDLLIAGHAGGKKERRQTQLR